MSASSRPIKSLRQRFLEKVDAEGDGCWPWKAAICNNGYGQLSHDYRRYWAHRVSYMLLVGPIPEGYHIDHLCMNRACVNPAHLEAVTQAENNRRASEAKYGGKCAREHEMTPENTYWRPDGKGRQCRICIEIRWRRAKRAAA